MVVYNYVENKTTTTYYNTMIQDFDKVYEMVNPNERFIIIEQIKNREIVPNTKRDWWKKDEKHDPKGIIQTRIYHGTIQQLYEKWCDEYEDEYMSFKDFKDYTREMIKQGIMV